MLAPLEILEQFRVRLEEAARSLPLFRPAGLASLVLELPQTPGTALLLPGPRFQFSHGHARELRAGYGAVKEWHAEGEDRLAELKAGAVPAFGDWVVADPDDIGVEPFALLGFAASPKAQPRRPDDPFPNALLSVPEVALYSRQGQGALILTTALPVTPSALRARWGMLVEQVLSQLQALAPEPLKTARLQNRDNQPDREAWRRLVHAALEQINLASLEKVVLSRRARFVGQRRFDVRRLVTALTYLFPSCQVIELRRGEVSFLAATPERLLVLHGRRLAVDAIAGTVRRAANAERDTALAAALRRSEKNRREHALVVEAIRNMLTPLCARLEIPEEPNILKLNNVQHLWSPISAELREALDLFRLAELLHPTPATNGQPRAAATAWLAQQESIERGWYTGAAGFVERNLSGELWVLLRVARIVGETAELFAGAGIVAGSNPASEWGETEDKLSAMLTALQYA